MTLTWLVGLLRRRRGRLAAAAVGVAVSVALLASLGTFLAASKATMTARAVQNVTVDWQVQVQPTADLRTVTEAVRATPQASDVQPVNFGQTSGFPATTQGTLQHTGPGIVVGLPSGYASAFPGQVRALTGTGEGTLLAQRAGGLKKPGGGKFPLYFTEWGYQTRPPDRTRGVSLTQPGRP